MKYLVTGVSGQLGHDVVLELFSRGYSKDEVYAPLRDELDITNKEQVEKCVLNFSPDVIVHCAAYTAVDKAEEDKEICYDINVNGTKYLVNAADKVAAKLIYISTDYVFDGTYDGFYEVDNEYSPINYYGNTKCLGEQIVREYNNYVIVRISWVFGINGKNFVKTMLKLSESKSEIGVVCDQIGSPTYTKDLARVLIDISLKDINGIFHITNEGYCSWYDFAKYIFEINNIDCKVNPILSKDYKTMAKRPMNSRLSKNCLDEIGVERMPSWQNAVDRYCKVLKKESGK